MRVGHALIPIVTIALSTLLPAARADEFVDRANQPYSTIRAERRSDTVLLPLVLKMQPPPAAVARVEQARLLPATSADFKAVEAWTTAEPQKAVLEALPKVTTGESFTDGFAFGQPYGDQAVAAAPGGIALVQGGLYTELGDPPLLGNAQFKYLAGLDRVAILCHAEATRLAAAGQPDKAIEVLISLVFLGRQIAERAFVDEARWGMMTMSGGLERIRDVVYLDFRAAGAGNPKITPEMLAAFGRRLREDGYIRTDLISFPKADRIAATQAVEVSFQGSGTPSPATFGPTMARLASTDLPLRMFAESAKWDQVGSVHADKKETLDQIAKVHGDWQSRWPLDWWDSRMNLASDYERTPKGRFAVVFATLKDTSPLFHQRQLVRAQLVGTRMCFAVLGFHSRAKNFPPLLTSTTPQYIKSVEADPFNPDRARGKVPPMEFFVPIRDAGRGAPGNGPHEMNIMTPGLANFQVRIDRDQFVMYSVGPNGIRDLAKDVTGEPAKDAVGDMLIWPPAVSLIRQRLVETGQLK